MSDTKEGSENSQQETASDEKIHEWLMNAINRRVDEVKVAYARTTLLNDRPVVDPVKQTRDDKDGKTCLVAVAINALKALKGSPIAITEEEVLKNLSESFLEDGQLRVGTVLEYIEAQGYEAEGIFAYPMKLVAGLAKGGVAIQVTPSDSDKELNHAKLLAGVRIDRGNIWFREYDPAPKKPTSRLLSLDQHIAELYSQNTTSLKSLNLLRPRAVPKTRNFSEVL